MLGVLRSALLLLAVTHSQPADAQDQRAAARARMVAEIAVMARETGAETGRPRFSEAVMAAMGKVPRHRFVPALQDIFAYDNRPLPIGDGQTISDRKSTRLNSSHLVISYAVFCLKKKKNSHHTYLNHVHHIPPTA